MRNWTNTIENALISIVTGILVFLAVTWSNQIIINNLTEELANKVTYSISNEFTKLKAKKDGEINLILDNQLQVKEDSIKEDKKERKRWFNRRR